MEREITTKSKEIKRALIITRLKEQGREGKEFAHINSDDLLLEYLAFLGETEIVEQYNQIKEGIGFWYS